ncbi:MAG TPA: MBL fold metallo-hydrolase, partial [Dongiaceae bacterium]|nr:MBL fold metallo-hydrolase [Dongiaceae bacterium]
EWRVVPLTSNAPPYSPRRDRPVAGDNIGLFITDQRNGRSLFYAPGLGVISPLVKSFMEKASCVLVDGTCWHDQEMEIVGCSKRSSAMGHLPLSGAGGMIEHLDTLTGVRKILIHINNTNPILDENSVERQLLHDQEIEVAHDGMVIEL